MRKRGFSTIDSLGRWLDERPEWFAARRGYDVVICTIPVMRSEVERFREAMPGTKLLGYFDPFYLDRTPGSAWREWQNDLPEANWFTDAETRQIVTRFGYDGFYLHTGLTARVMARELALLAVRAGLDGLHLDNFDSELLYRFPRTIRCRGTIRTFPWQKINYWLSSRLVLGALLNEFPNGLLIANSGQPWATGLVPHGRTQERYVTPQTFAREPCAWNFAYAYPDTWPSLKTMIADGTLPESVGIMEDRTLGEPIA